jgi:GNAT superfamily N-acetyltransferase
MNTDWQIREATLEDAASLKCCMEKAYAVYLDRISREQLPPLDADYVSEIKNHPTWVVEFEGRLVGGLIMTFENNEALIANIAIAPKFQGQGIGGALMRFAGEKAQTLDCFEIFLTTHELLTENISLYQHLGWKEIAREEGKVFMKKGLD